MTQLGVHSAFTGLPCWIFFRFQDIDMYYPIDVEQIRTYKTTMGRNIAAAGINAPKEEWKSVTHIPVSDLYICHSKMMEE